MISVRFGLHLDGAYTAAADGRIGHATLGPAAFLGMLELHLGLSSIPPRPSERVVQYCAALKAVDNPKRFFHASLQADELGVAATLLSWRDAWYLHGWDGNPHPALAGRLGDLAAVEELARQTVAPCAGQRLAAVLIKLGERKTPIADVELADPAAAMPLAWRRVLAALPTRNIACPPPASGKTFLGQLQARLAAETIPESRNRLRWKDDGSVRLVQSDSLLLAGRWLGQTLAATQGEQLVLAGAHGQLLDDILSGANAPRHGFNEISAFRPGLQILPLAMALLWAPLDIFACLDFLTHPLCPLPRRISRRLAEKVAERPGLTQETVDQVMPDFDAYYRERAARVRQDIDSWLFRPRHALQDGALLADAMGVAQQLAAVLRTRMSDVEEAEAATLGVALGQCRAVSEALQRLIAAGQERIQRPQLGKLIRQVTAAGSSNTMLLAELGCAMSTEHPGSVVCPVDHLYWWQLTAPAGMPRSNWSRAEQHALAEAGIEIPSAKQLLEQQASEWLRPILNARKTLTLVLPPTGGETHPIWQLLGCHVDTLPVSALTDLLTQKGAQVAMARAPQRSLSVPRRWWTLKPGLIDLRPSKPTSYSALEKYLFSPFEWVLRYPAQLQSSTLLCLPDNRRLFGNLAHALVDKLFQRPDALKLSPGKLASWLEQAIEELVDADGAVLRLPGHRIELDRFRRQAHRAIERLVAHMKTAQVTSVRTELRLQGSYVGGDLTGFADLLLTNSQGKHGVVDMKWGGKRHAENLANQTHLQLIIYAGLISQMEHSWPDAGYFILSEARLLASDTRYFPDVQVVPAGEAAPMAELWNRFEKSWKWRQQQLRKGRIEVPLEGLDPDDDCTPPIGCLAVEPGSIAYSDFPHLIGLGH